MSSLRPESTEPASLEEATRGGLPPGASRAVALSLGTGWAVILGAGSLGLAFSPWLVVNAPLLLIALSPLPRHLLFVAPKLELLPFVVVAVLRSEAWSALWYFTGITYGERGIRWFEGRNVRMGGLVRAGERLFRRASLPLLLVSPNPLFCLLAGAWGVRPALFFPLTVLGQAAWIVITHRVGAAFAELIASMTQWIGSHVAELTLGTVLFTVGALLLRQLRNRRNLRPG
jgi:membrane protein DedA with SNARE-associated domain